MNTIINLKQENYKEFQCKIDSEIDDFIFPNLYDQIYWNIYDQISNELLELSSNIKTVINKNNK
jgi:hypothetical protein